MPMLAAAAPAISAISGLAGTGMSVANAIGQGNNPGTQALDPNIGKMDPNAFGYGGGILGPEQQQYAAEYAQAKKEHDAIAAEQVRLGQVVQRGEMLQRKNPVLLTDEERQAIRFGQNAEKQLVDAEAKVQASAARLSGVQRKIDGSPGLAQSEANRVGGLADAARARELTKADLSNFNESRNAFKAGGANVDQAMGLQRTAALGEAPSVAQMQLRQGLDQANAQAAGLAASARGGGGNLALAARAAQTAQSQNAMASNQQNAMLRASEMAQARDAYADTAVKARAQQLEMAGVDADTAMKQAQLEVQDRQTKTLEAMGYEGLKQGIYGAQQSGKQAYQTGTAQNQINVATGNRSAANEGFQNQQAATAGAVQMGGRALEGVTQAAGKYYPQAAPATKTSHTGGTWQKTADGSYRNTKPMADR